MSNVTLSPGAVSSGLVPLELDRLQTDEPASQTIARTVWGFLILGTVIRLARYLLCFPLWGDESFVAANFLERGYADLLRPLDYHQVCPPLFLWAELTCVRLVGFSEYGLRLFPCVVSIASLFLFRHLAGLLLRGIPLVLAVAIFAVAYFPIRHGAEVKPYASDLFASLVLVTLACQWLAQPQRNGWLWALAGAVGVAVGLSYPAVFVAGGISLALAWPVWKSRSRQTMLAWIVYNVVLVATFLTVLVVVSGAQYERESTAGQMHAYWQEAFPPWQEPLALVGWLIDTHTSFTFAYPIGGKRGGSALTTLAFLVAVVVLYRRRGAPVTSVFVLPFALALVAAAMHRYPYGGSARVMLYLAPLICLMAGLGGAVLIATARRPQVRFRIAGGVLIAMVVLGLSSIVRDLVQPYKTVYDQNDRWFAYWLWNDKAHDAQLVCVKTDLGKDFYPLNYEWGHSAQYLCNQRIYSARHRQGSGPPDWDAVTHERPLRCVIYNMYGLTRQEDDYAEWLASMGQRFTLADQQVHLVNPGTMYAERFEILEFVPRAGDESAELARQREAASTR